MASNPSIASVQQRQKGNKYSEVYGSVSQRPAVPGPTGPADLTALRSCGFSEPVIHQALGNMKLTTVNLT